MGGMINFESWTTKQCPLVSILSLVSVYLDIFWVKTCFGLSYFFAVLNYISSDQQQVSASNPGDHNTTRSDNETSLPWLIVDSWQCVHISLSIILFTVYFNTGFQHSGLSLCKVYTWSTSPGCEVLARIFMEAWTLLILCSSVSRY